jgi:hypothetical protein
VTVGGDGKGLPERGRENPRVAKRREGSEDENPEGSQLDEQLRTINRGVTLL